MPGENRDQFIVGNSLWTAPREVGFAPAQIYLVLEQRKGLPVCPKHTLPPRPRACIPLKKSEGFPLE